MKIRNGFVSNSSSSSFCIFGLSFPTGELNSIEENFEDNIWNLTYDVNLECYNGLDKYYDEICIGIDMTSLPRDKTLDEIEVEVQEKLKNIFPKEFEIGKLKIIVDGGYQG